ncbi:YdbL family protein [Photobacterium sp. S4TG1]|uniref:YdbL family protein n=1 Tax=Photobacterium sp. S4TG1 TaxID=3114587 RepID=UPI002E17B428|nr:YdbL family protein [Photobacterium sp. S4TG1]
MKSTSLCAVLLGGYLLLFNTSPVFAITLQQAKQQGLVGETNTGFIAAIKPTKNPDVNRLINSVNNHRQKTYRTISQSHDLPLSTIKQQAYKKAVEKTQTGHFYQNNQGAWKKK